MIKIKNISEIDPGLLKERENSADVYAIVSDIISNVRSRGDAALVEYSLKFDKAKLECIEVSQEEIESAYGEMDEEFISILKEAKENIWNYHKNQLRDGFEIKGEDGIVLGQKITPLSRVGLYVPGGTAAYPSTVLMNCIPAKIAGVKEIVMTTPCMNDGKIAPAILTAAKIAGVDRIFKIGGAQAVAALAYGTETVPEVDKIVGPGNCFVAEAKRQVYGKVAIDMIAGPSEILVIADNTCDPRHTAADLLSQAEHDKLASAVLITNDREFALRVSDEVEKQLKELPRYEIARASIDNYGYIIITDTIEQAIDLANDIAPEHLELCCDDPFKYLDLIVNAGSIFLGKYCPEALGDYFSGTNHTLPTSGTAKFSSPLSVDDFIKKSAYSYYTCEALEKVNKKIAYFAEKEGFAAHARSATIRFEK